MSKLKPCPFCGSKNVKLVDSYYLSMGGLSFAECNNPKCDAIGPRRTTDRGAVRSWNKAPRKEEARR